MSRKENKSCIEWKKSKRKNKDEKKELGDIKLLLKFLNSMKETEAKVSMKNIFAWVLTEIIRKYYVYKFVTKKNKVALIARLLLLTKYEFKSKLLLISKYFCW